MRRWWVACVAAGVMAVAGVAGCGPTSPEALPGAPSGRLVSPEEAAVRAAERERLERLRRQREALEAGWEVGFTNAWKDAVEEARDQGPVAFRKQVVGAWWPWGLAALVLGFALRALVVLREERGGQRRRFEAVLGRFARPVARALVGPTREAGDAWPRALRTAQDAERHLRLACEAAMALGKTDGRGARVAERLSGWRDELATLRRGLEARGPFVPWVREAAHLAALEQASAAAAQLKVGLVRAVAGEAAPAEDDWLEWERQLNVRPQTPTLKASAASTAEDTSWVRPTGWVGVGLTAASVPFIAGWLAAGAVPTGVAAVAAVVGLGTLLFARTHLRMNDSPPLLPGAADALSMRLVAVVGVALGLLVVSATTDPESGLNLGAPPPLTLPEKVPVAAIPASLSVAPPPAVPPSAPSGAPAAAPSPAGAPSAPPGR